MRTLSKSKLLLFILLFSLNKLCAQIVIELSPIQEKLVDKEWSATINITNEMDEAFNLEEGKFHLNWPNTTYLDPETFLNTENNGDLWAFTIRVNWGQGTLQPNEILTTNTSGNRYIDFLNFPTNGEFKTDNGEVFQVQIKSYIQEADPTQTDFDRACFLHSPTENLCLGEAATEIWKGTGIRDVMVTEDRASYAIGIMVTHRLFSNLIGTDTLLSPHFWWATGINETGMICEGTDFVARRKNHCDVNASDESCERDRIGENKSNESTGNCFQLLAYDSFLATNQPDLFSQTNEFGTAASASVVEGGNLKQV